MPLIDELCRVAKEQHQDAELPDFILAEILEIAKNPALLEKEDLVRRLTAQLHNFDLYSGAGCFGDSCGVNEISDTLKIISKYLAPPC